MRALTHALDHDRLHHAYLFTGTRGIGKTTIARILARSLNCERGVSATPCGECGICREVLEGRFVDLIEVDAASRTGVEDTRDLLDNAQYLPSSGRYKVYLIDEVHMLSKAAFNALLKTLEEPPPHVVFLLATTDPKKLPITVLSRCLQFQLKSLSAASIDAYLTQVLTTESIDFEPAAVELLAAAARGSMRDALSVTDQAIAHGGGAVRTDDVVAMLGSAGRDELAALMRAIADQQAAPLLALVAELAERAVDFKELLEALIAEWHRYAVAQATGGEASPFDAETVQLNYQIALLGLRDLEILPDPRLGFEMTLLRMLAFAPAPAPAPEPDKTPAGTSNTSTGSAPQVRSAQDVSRAQRETRAQSETTPAPRTAIDPALADRWYQLVDQLNLTGVARMLAEHALPLSLDGATVSLALDAGHDMLLVDVQQQRLADALSEQAGTRVELTVQLHELDRESPAQRRLRLHAERQAAAEAATRADATVNLLLNTFGGEVRRVTLLEDLDSAQQQSE